MVRLLLVLLALWGASTAARQPVFRAGTDLVTFGVTVTDRRGEFPGGLEPGDFEVLEDGVRQTISFFAHGGQPASAPTLHLGLLFDTSGSMGQDITLARSAAVRFLNTLREAVDITLVDFDTEVRVARYDQDDFARIVERIRARKPDGMTALYDALGVYLQESVDDDGRTILVIFTDGGDTRSTLHFSDLVTGVRASDITVYTVGFLQNQRGGRMAERLQLEQLSAESGGTAFFPTSMKEIEEAYDKIRNQVRAQYSLGYVSTNAKRDGTWRKVEIRVRRPGLDSLRVQTRKGYFAPLQR